MFCIFASMETKNENMYLSEKDIYEGLLNEDENVFKALFYDEKFRTVVGIVRASIFKVRDFESVKAEIYNELYFFLFSRIRPCRFK